MSEFIRSVVVHVEVDTNKRTYKDTLTWGEDVSETLEEYIGEVAEMIRDSTDV